MSVTVASLYNTLCFDLLEDGGLSLGIVTQAEFLDYLGQVLMDFLRRTDMVRLVYSTQIGNGTSTYDYPNNPYMTKVHQAFVNAQIIDHVDLFAQQFVGNFQPNTDNAPVQVWHQDGIAIEKVDLQPTPTYNGATAGLGFNSFSVGSRNLTLVGSVNASKEFFLATDTLDTIPDSFTPYLVYGILEKIFSTDGESKDEQRALYCHSRYEEGVALGQAILLTAGVEEQERPQQRRR